MLAKDTSTNHKIKVSISLVTFNHEKFIAQAIESILSQRVDFNYEIIIGEDYSSDKTRDIVLDYYKRYPDKIRLILPNHNLGCYGQKIFVQTLAACRGEYIALLDGDDYWTSPDKLQTQVDFLDKHPECAICFHDVICLEESTGKYGKYNDFAPPRISSIENILKTNFIPTCSTLYRNGLFDQFPQWYEDTVCGDWVLHVLNAQHGKIGYINQVLGVYRIHANGVFSSMRETQQLQEALKCYKYLNLYLQFRYNNLIKSEEAYRYYGLAIAYYKDNQDPTSAKIYALKCLQCLFSPPFIRVTALIKLCKRILLNSITNSKLQIEEA